jgi:uncharacterized membrane protein
MEIVSIGLVGLVGLVGLGIATIIILINLGSRFINLESTNKEILDNQRRTINRLDLIEENFKGQKVKAQTQDSQIPFTAPSSKLPPPLPEDLTNLNTKPTKEYKRPVQLSSDAQTSQHINKTSPPTPTPTSNLGEGTAYKNQFVEWLKEDWLMKVGSIMVLLALGWFVTYAFMNNWIGPAGRILVGSIIAGSILVLGTKRLKQHPNQGGVFLSIGGAIMITTMFAASNFYDVLPPIIALLISAASLGYIAKKAIECQSRALVYLSIALATICPFLFGYLGNTEFVLAYLLALILAIAYINWNWELEELPVISATITFFYSAPYIIFEFNNWANPSALTLTLAFSTIAIIIAQNLYNLSKANESKTTVNSISSVLGTITLIGWSMKIGSDLTPGFVLAAWALILALISRILYLKTENKKAFFTTWALSTTLGILSLNILLNIPEITLGLLGVAIINIVIAQRTSPNSKLSAYISFIMALPCLSALKSITSQSWALSPINMDGLVLLLVSISLLTMGLWFKKLNNKDFTEEKKITSYLELILGSIFSFCLIWLVSTNSLDKSISIALSLSIYTVVGLICYYAGLKKPSTVLRKYGLILLGLIIARLFIIDLWNMEIAGRITTFFAVGILLISTAFLSKTKNKNK